MKNAFFLDVTLCGSCKNRRFGGTYRLHHQGDKNRIAEVDRMSHERPVGKEDMVVRTYLFKMNSINAKYCGI
jgi:hypothetical protein